MKKPSFNDMFKDELEVTLERFKHKAGQPQEFRMKPRIRPIKDLYFRFIKDTPFDGVIDAQHAAHCLSKEGFIELTPHFSKPIIEHYRDDKFAAMGELDIIERVLCSFREYIAYHKLSKQEGVV